MKISNIHSYLVGDEFSNGLKIYCFTNEEVTDRLDFLVKQTRGKKIINIGFSDHLPLIAEKVKHNRWLHKKLAENCERCIGLDINQAAIDFVQKELDIQQVYYHDVINDEPLDILKNEKFDFIVLGDVLEHIDNPVQFLQAINKKYFGIADKIIITVPNAFDFANLRLLKKNIEFINTDHRYWFTPFTIAKVVHQSGLEIERQGFCNPPNHRLKLVTSFLRKYPIVSETIYLIAKLRG